MESQKLTGLLFAIILSLAGCTGDVDDDEKGITHVDNEPSESLSIYHFEASDSSDNLTNSTGDNMIDIVLNQGQQGSLNWSSVEIRISIDSDAPVYCVADDSSASCTYASDSDLTWDVGESITISEGSNTDLCDGSTGCIVEVTIMKTENGTSHVLDEIEADAE
tara:strand:+ start:227 stop:718 length:492 start_codon:yes stop_codon:yes gene_type:complete